MPQRLEGILSLGKDEVGRFESAQQLQKILFSIENRIFFFAYFCSMGEGLKQSGRMLLPLR